jgi:hypothetical protein
MLESLSADGDSRVRRAVASNSKTPLSILETVARTDGIWAVIGS